MKGERRAMTWMLTLALMALAPACSAMEHRGAGGISSAADVAQAMHDAKPGDVITLADGHLKDQLISITGKGTAENPITVRAQTPGKVILDGDSRVIIFGEHVIVSGLMFADSDTRHDAIQINGIENRVTETAIVAPNRGGKWIHFMAGARRCRVDHCYIEGHAPADVRMQVEVDADEPNDHRIDHNHFGPRPPLKKNGGETIRVGYSYQSMRTSRSLFEYNLFDRCDGEIEIISNKSCENVYRYNTFRDSNGTLTLRHGNRCVVEGNYFFGDGAKGKPTGGIRVIGEDHTIINNYFEATNGIAGGVINLTTGIEHPQLKEYFQIKKCFVAFNTFVDNAAPSIVVDASYGTRKNRTMLPENVTVANNLFISSQATTKPIVGGTREGENFRWVGNIACGDQKIGAVGAAGFKNADVKMHRDADGVLRPDDDSAVRGAAEGEFSSITKDIDGQPRGDKKDVGCDQISDAPATNRPLKPFDVGPSWMKGQTNRTKHAEAAVRFASAHRGGEASPVDSTTSTKLEMRGITIEYQPAGKRLVVGGFGAAAGGWNVRSLAPCPLITDKPVTASVVDHRDALGSGRAIELRSDAGVQHVWIYDDAAKTPFVCSRVTLHNGSEADQQLASVTPLRATIENAAPAEVLRLFASDGLSPATKSNTSYVFISLVEPKSRGGVVSGWLTHERASGVVSSSNQSNGYDVQARSEYGRLIIPAGKDAPGEVFAIGVFDDARLGLEAFADAIAKLNDIKLPPVYNGYSTWYHAHASDQDRMAKLAKFAHEEKLTEYGLNFLQIDDGWQVARRDFTTHKTGEKAPYRDGMKKTADAIKANGLFAGIWLTPFGWDSKLPLMAEHQDWFVHRHDGGIYDVKWAGDCLDMSHPQARKFLADVVSRMTHDWGYRLLKIDGLWAGMACKILYPSPEYRDDGLGDAVFYDKSKTNVEVYRDGLKLVREAAGKDSFLLGCNIAQNMRTMGASIGLVDAMRVGPDIKANWDAVVRCAKPATRLYFWNGRVWHNDPDCLMLRDPLTLDNARAWASWIAVSGQMNLVSEWLPDLPPEKLDIYKRTIPNHGKITARPVDLFEHDMPRIWQLTGGEGEDRHDVIAVFNWNRAPDAKSDAGTAQEEPTTQAAARLESGPITVKLDPPQLGLPASPDGYVAFDFWDNRFVDSLTGPMSLDLPPGSCKVLAVRRKSANPQVLSTSRHISQGIVDLTYVRWQNGQRVLEGRSRVVGQDDYELRIDSGKGNTFDTAEVSSDDTAAGVTAVGKQDGNQLRVTIKSPASREVAWKIRFASDAK